MKITWLNRTLSIRTSGGKFYSIRVKKKPTIEPMGVRNRFTLGNLCLSTYDQSHASIYKLGRRSRNYIIGISGSAHDSAAVLLHRQNLLSAIEEERMTRTKHDSSQFPVNAILELLRINHLQWDDIDHLAVAWNYNDYTDTNHAPSPMLEFFQQLDIEKATQGNLPLKQLKRRSVPERTLKRCQPRTVDSFLKRMSDLTGSGHIPSVCFAHHHLAHAASAYFPSDLPEPVLVLTLDGYGECTTTSVWLGNGGKLRHIDSIYLPHSLGWAFCSITEYLGFQPLSREGEVMGFAAYGAPRTEEEIERVEALRRLMGEFIIIDPLNGTFRVNEDWIYFGKFPWDSSSRVSQTMIECLKPLVPRLFSPSPKINPESPSDRGAANLAFVFQQRIEQVLLHMVRHFLYQNPKTKNVPSLALAGGIAFNVNANARLIAGGIIPSDCLFIPPAAGDAGTALGAALLVAQTSYGCDPRFRMRRADYGSEYSDAEIQTIIKDMGLVENEDYCVLHDYEEIVNVVAGMLAKKQAVAWYQGRSEFGPRALGHRSILLNVQDTKANKMANQMKRRQLWRPSAISVIQDKAGEYLQGLSGAETPFMTISFPVKESARAKLASGYHYADGSTRPQTVTERDNPLFYRLLQTLGEKNYIPAVVNTSFNRKEPLVNTPEEAINTFYYIKDLDALCMGHFLITYRGNINPTIRSFEDEELTSVIFNSAINLSDTEAWDILFNMATQWLGTCARILAIIRDQDNNETKLEWPLVKEFFSSTVGKLVQDYIATALYNQVLIEGVSEVFVGSTHSNYNLVVFDRITTALQQLMLQRDKSNNIKQPITVRQLFGHIPPIKHNS